MVGPVEHPAPAIARIATIDADEFESARNAPEAEAFWAGVEEYRNYARAQGWDHTRSAETPPA